ncbi:MAG: glycine zipper 2TM domain-containing protein [Verrucomicrobiota bacterium]
MKKLVLLPLCLAVSILASCTPGERGATTGALIGGGVGAAVAGSGNRATGALIGGALGAFTGSEISKNRAYRNRRGYWW